MAGLTRIGDVPNQGLTGLPKSGESRAREESGLPKIGDGGNLPKIGDADKPESGLRLSAFTMRKLDLLAFGERISVSLGVPTFTRHDPQID